MQVLGAQLRRLAGVLGAPAECEPSDACALGEDQRRLV